MVNIVQLPTDWSTIKKLLWLRGGIGSGDQGEDLTVTGTPPLSLPNSLGKPLKAWSVDLLPYQEGSGDPSPDNVRAIHGTDKVTVLTSGKNLLDKSTLIVNSYVKDDGTFAFSEVWSRTGYLELPSGEYVASGLSAGGSNAYICSYDANKQPILASITGIIANTDTTFTIPENGKYVVLSVRTGDGSADTAQLEFGSTATDYTPYIAPSQTVITLPQTVYNGTVGSEGGESSTAKYIITADDVRSFAFESSVLRVYLSRNIHDGNNAFKIGRCNKYTFRDSYISVMNNNNSIAFNTSGNQLLLRDDTITSFQQLKDSITAEPIVCEYPLTTPTEFSLATPSIQTPKGTAITWATAENGTVDSMSVTYVGKA